MIPNSDLRGRKRETVTDPKPNSMFIVHCRNPQVSSVSGLLYVRNSFEKKVAFCLVTE
jgi:hypothetical protein